MASPAHQDFSLTPRLSDDNRFQVTNDRGMAQFAFTIGDPPPPSLAGKGKFCHHKHSKAIDLGDFDAISDPKFTHKKCTKMEVLPKIGGDMSPLVVQCMDFYFGIVGVPASGQLAPTYVT